MADEPSYTAGHRLERLGVPLRTFLRAIDIYRRHGRTNFIDIWTTANPEMTAGTFLRVHVETGKVERITIRTNEGDDIMTIREADGFSVESTTTKNGESSDE